MMVFLITSGRVLCETDEGPMDEYKFENGDIKDQNLVTAQSERSYTSSQYRGRLNTTYFVLCPCTMETCIVCIFCAPGLVGILDKGFLICSEPPSGTIGKSEHSAVSSIRKVQFGYSDKAIANCYLVLRGLIDLIERKKCITWIFHSYNYSFSCPFSYSRKLYFPLLIKNLFHRYSLISYFLMLSDFVVAIYVNVKFIFRKI